MASASNITNTIVNNMFTSLDGITCFEPTEQFLNVTDIAATPVIKRNAKVLFAGPVVCEVPSATLIGDHPFYADVVANENGFTHRAVA